MILAAPHGGDLTPDSIPLDRDAGCWDGTKCVYRHDCGEKNFDKLDFDYFIKSILAMWVGDRNDKLDFYYFIKNRFGTIL